MTIFGYLLPMTQMRRVVVLVYEGFELLDLSGPAAVFSTANSISGGTLYTTLTASTVGGIVVSGCGIGVDTLRWRSVRVGARDTVLAAGALEVPLIEAIRSRALAQAFRRASVRAERYGSICTGSLLLGAAGLLSGKRVATHWAGCKRLASRFNDATVEADAMYVTDGRLWTSAGVTTGIDMALAMLQRDHGARLMGQVAKHLIVYSHRPGHQSQFSELLSLQTAASGAFADLATWLESKIGQPVKVSDMARRVRMSERTFHRRFTAAIGITPFKYLDYLRLERAKRNLETNQGVKTVAA